MEKYCPEDSKKYKTISVGGLRAEQFAIKIDQFYREKHQIFKEWKNSELKKLYIFFYTLNQGPVFCKHPNLTPLIKKNGKKTPRTCSQYINLKIQTIYRFIGPLDKKLLMLKVAVGFLLDLNFDFSILSVTLLKGADSLDFGKPNLFSYEARKSSFFMKTARNFDMMKKT